MNDSDVYKIIRKQIEYYLSDENLRNDRFFHGKITSSPDSSVSLETFLNCNKIRKMNTSVEKIKKALENSSVLKLTEDGNGVRRISTTLPPLRSKQLLLTLDKKKETTNPDNVVVFVPLILTFPVTSDIYFKARDLEKKIPKLFLAEVPYCKISKKQGVVVFNEKTADLDALADFTAQEHNIDKIAIKFQQLSPEDTLKWFKNNRSYLEEALKKKYDYGTLRENSENGPAQLSIDDLYGPVTIGDRTFSNFREAKNYFKGVIAKTRNGETLREEDTGIVKALLPHHSQSGTKTKEMIGITVDCHPQYPTTRCFFIQKHDGEHEDFSYFKCLTQLYNELLKTKK